MTDSSREQSRARAAQSFSPADARRVVVIGGGMAAQRLVEKLVERALGDALAVTMLSEESHLPYDRIHLGDLLGGRSAEALAFRDETWFGSRGVVLRRKERVTTVDRARRIVTTESGLELEYDALVLATGGSPVVPPIPGVELDAVTTYRTVDDVERIDALARPGHHVMIAGGGLLGIEAAHTLRERGCTVDVVERAMRLLPRQLDVEGAAVLQAQIESAGIGLRLGATIAEIHQAEISGSREKEAGVRVALADDTYVDAHAVVLAVGIRPRDDLARAAGLVCHDAGGVVVDERLATSDPHVFAIGECTRFEGETQGFVSPCYGMADVLAARFAGDDARFEQATPSVRLKVDTIDVGAVGESLAEGIGVQSLEWNAAHAYRRIVLREGRVVGAIAVGSTDDLPALQERIARRARVGEWERRRFARSGRLTRTGGQRPVARWPDAAVLCTCTGVTCGVLREARAAGATTSAALCQTTGASGVCGTCRPLVEELAGECVGAARASAGRGLAVASATAFGLIALALWLSPIPMSTSVEHGPGWDLIWRDSWWKQVSGFSLVGLTVASLGLSLRKRWPRIRWGGFAQWRLLHSVLGAGTILGVGVHTGFRLGANLNFVLMTCFAAVLVLGSMTALVTSLESRLPPTAGALLRRGWTTAHILLFWPLPVLIGFHVLAVYFY